MNLLECIVGLGIGMMVLAPMLNMTSTVLMKQSQLERTTLELAEQERMFTFNGPSNSDGWISRSACTAY